MRFSTEVKSRRILRPLTQTFSGLHLELNNPNSNRFFEPIAAKLQQQSQQRTHHSLGPLKWPRERDNAGSGAFEEQYSQLAEVRRARLAGLGDHRSLHPTRNLADPADVRAQVIAVE